MNPREGMSWLVRRCSPMLIVLLCLITLFGCHTKTETPGQPLPATVYTCSMHPQVESLKPGTCPICGMRLVPRTVEMAPGEQGHDAVNTSPSVSGIYISPERQQLIGVRTMVVERKPTTQEIRTVGHVAFDPDLMIAQREYIESLRLGDRSLIEASELHLRHLGISDQELLGLKNKRQEGVGLFLPRDGASVWVYASLFEHELPHVRTGLPAAITLQSSRGTYDGIIRAIDPIIDPRTRAARARIEIEGAGGILRPDTYVNVAITIDLGEQITVPTTAVIDTGERTIVILRQNEGHFTPHSIQTGVSLGDALTVIEGLSGGETIVTRATFLINSESSLKSTLGKSGGGHHH